MNRLSALFLTFMAFATSAFAQSKMEQELHKLDEVVVKGVAKKLVVREDTFIYNADAYKTPEGSTIEELVRKLPGAQVSDDGKVTINGKEVKKIKVDGKEFMTGDTQTALKNLPTAIIDKVKAYDEKSDQARLTGVDDGEEETVLDFNIRQGMNKGFMANIDLAIGTHKRYAERVMGAYMKDNSRLMLFGNANNTGDRGFSSGGRGGAGGGNGLMANKMLGINYNYELKDKLKADFSIRWNHSDTDNWQKSATENFVSTKGSFTNSISQQYGRSNKWDIRGKVEWKIDTLTTLIVRPTFTGSSTDSRGDSHSSTFSRDPFQYSDDPWNMDESTGGADLWVNSKKNNSLSYGTSNAFNIQATLSRKLAANGRNVTTQVRYNVGNADTEDLSTQFVKLYQLSEQYYKNRYNITPTKNWGLQLNATYSEPIAKATFIQFKYQYQYSNKTSDRSTYDFSDEPDFYRGVTPEYRDFDFYLAPYRPLTESSPYYSSPLSRYSEYDNYVHQLELTLKRTRPKYNLNVGVMLQPQVSHLTYKYLGNDFDVRRTVTDFTPTLDFRYKWNKKKTLRVNYRGRSAQPSMTDMLPITDDTDPLNIKVGNPELKPSFTNTMRVQYNNYVSSHMQTVMAFLNYQMIRNSVSNSVEYDDQTGGRTTKPMNINGDWSIDAAMMYNAAVDSVGKWNFNSFANVSYKNDANYTYLTDTKQTEKNYTRTTNLSERIGIGYRLDWIEVELNGQVQYTISSNKLQPNANLNSWQFQYGTDITLTAPWGTSFSTGAHMQSRRGFADAAMNTNEFVWNAQIAQSCLKSKALTFSLQFYDILHEKSSFSRAVSASQRSDTWYNSINSYCMLHVIYRFNAFGGKQSRRGNRPDGEFGDRPPRGEGGFGGGERGNRGGFGGGSRGMGGGPRF